MVCPSPHHKSPTLIDNITFTAIPSSQAETSKIHVYNALMTKDSLCMEKIDGMTHV